MEQLDVLMDKLDSDKFCAVSLYDSHSSLPIYRNLSHEQIQEEFGNAESLFEKIYNDGHTRVKVQQRRKNGTNAFKNEGEPFEITFSEIQNPPKNVPEEKQGKVLKKKKKKKKRKTGLMGLGMAEIFDLKLQAHDREELSRKLQEIQVENKDLKAKNDELLEEKLQRKYTKESNDSLNNMLLGVAKQAPLILRGLGFNVPVEQSGLSIASGEDYQEDSFSQTKKGFLDIVKTLDDDTISLLSVIYQKINEKTEDNSFSQELFGLLQQHQMIV